MRAALAHPTARAPHSRRPAAVPHAPLPPFDPSDEWGNVHTTLPPEQVIPPNPSRDWWRADFSGVCLPEVPPYVDGANTTPPNMTMSFQLPLYPQPWIDTILAEHALRGYSHFHLSRGQFEQAGMSLADSRALVEYVQSWGFYASVWLTGSGDDRSRGWTSIGGVAGPFRDAMLATDCDRLILLPGEELNNGCPPGADGVDSIIRAVCQPANACGVPVWLHFTSNYPGYPANVAEGDLDRAMVEWIAQWRGRVRGLCWQSDPSASAGYMGAKLWDARRFWYEALGEAGLVCAFELLATEKLYGRCSEDYGCLRGWELICCTRGEPCPDAPPVMGFADGGRYPDGSPL